MYDCSSEFLAYLNILLLTLKACWYSVEGFYFSKIFAILSFFTNFTELLVIIYQLWQIIVCFKWNQHKKRLQKYQFFVFYLTTMVFLSFSTLYFIDPQLIISKSHQIPSHILFAFHGGTFIVMLFQVFFSNGKIELEQSLISCTNLLPSLLYLLFVYINWFNSKKLPYPFLKEFSPMIGFIIIFFGIVMINFIWLIVVKSGKSILESYEYQQEKKKRDKIQ